MSTKTSHRRKNRRVRVTVAELINQGGVPVPPKNVCFGQCRSQGCEECHDIDNCVEGTHRYGDLLLCADCRDHHPVRQPWLVDPESGEYVDTTTGRVL
jgi:hypothetical protein